jgi:hypothetical protein
VDRSDPIRRGTSPVFHLTSANRRRTRSPFSIPAARLVAVVVLHLYIQMRYEWDGAKNRLNQKKHGVSFELAALALKDENNDGTHGDGATGCRDASGAFRCACL